MAQSQMDVEFRGLGLRAYRAPKGFKGLQGSQRGLRGGLGFRV